MINHRLLIPVDDHFAHIIVKSLREQSKRETGIYKALCLILAHQVEQETLRYQTQESAALAELRGIRQVAPAREVLK